MDRSKDIWIPANQFSDWFIDKMIVGFFPFNTDWSKFKVNPTRKSHRDIIARIGFIQTEDSQKFIEFFKI